MKDDKCGEGLEGVLRTCYEGKVRRMSVCSGGGEDEGDEWRALRATPRV